MTHSQYDTLTVRYSQYDTLAVRELIESINIKKSEGIDEIPLRILKIGADYAAEPIADIFNLSIMSGSFPSQFKRARIAPIFKKGHPTVSSNYRPISILPTLSKLLETLINSQLTSHFEMNELFNDCQKIGVCLH